MAGRALPRDGCHGRRYGESDLFEDIVASDGIALLQEQTGVCSAPVVQLLRVSYVVRHVTLEVVGKVFNLRYIRDGLGWYEAPF